MGALILSALLAIPIVFLPTFYLFAAASMGFVVFLIIPIVLYSILICIGGYFYLKSIKARQFAEENSVYTFLKFCKIGIVVSLTPLLIYVTVGIFAAQTKPSLKDVLSFYGLFLHSPIFYSLFSIFPVIGLLYLIGLKAVTFFIRDFSAR
jgi:hypothetical protein